jgi:hypothetical protein
MTEFGKIIIIVVGILAIYGMWTLVMYLALQYAHRNVASWRTKARELAELAVTWQQHLAGANHYFNSATQIDAAPYANPVGRARKIVKYGYDLAGQAVKAADRCSRREIKQNPPSNRYFIVPPLLEIIIWSRHAIEIRRVTAQLVRVKKMRQELAAIDSEIAVLGHEQKRLFEELRMRAAELEAQRKNLAGPNNPLITEGVSLAGATTLLDMVMDGMLSADDPPRQNVVDAYRWYVELQQILNEVDKKMRRRPSPAQDANYALQVALRHYSRFEQALAVDSKQYGPFPQLSTKALALKKQLGQVSGMLQAQKYQPALEQVQQLLIEIQAQHNTREQIKLWRGKASELYAQAYGIIAGYETELASAHQTYEMDISDLLMESARLLLRSLDDLRLSEDLVQLTEINQIKRNFDLGIVEIEGARKSFTERAVAIAQLQAKINQTTVDEVCKRAVALSASHPTFSQPISPDVLTTLRASVLAEWRVFAVQLTRPKQGQLESLAKLMEHPLQLQTQLSEYCDDAARSLAQTEIDRQAAQTTLRQIDDLMPECANAAEGWDASTLATMAGFRVHRDEQARELARPEGDRLDYTALKGEAAGALEQMRSFVTSYADQRADLLKQMGALRQLFEGVKGELKELITTGLLDLQVDGRFHYDIQAWIIAFQDQASDVLLREVQLRLDSGNRLMAETRNYIMRLKQDRDVFLAEQKRVEDHAAVVSKQVDDAIQIGRGTYSDDTKDQPDRIAPIRLQVDKANATLARLSPSAQRFTLANGRADLKLVDSLLEYAGLMWQNL